jgi:uncharacterized protein
MLFKKKKVLKMNNIILEIKNFVEFECKKPSSKYGYEPFPFHFAPMVNYALILADKLNADKEIVEISGWLHDIGSIIYGRKNHHITSAKIAEEKLLELNYPIDKIERVKRCILNHRGSQDSDYKYIEEKIISDADALSNFDNISGIFKAAFIYENMNQGDAKKSVYDKLTRKFEKLQFEESKELIKPKYLAVKELFNY